VWVELQQPIINGQNKSSFSVSPIAKAFICFVVVEAIFLVIDRMILFYQQDDDNSNWLFGIMLINVIFFVYLCFSSILNENMFEMYAFIAASLLLSFRVLLDYFWQDEDCSTHPFAYCMTQMVVILVLQLVYLVMGYYVIKEMGWKFYKEVGSDLNLKKMYSIYQAFLSFAKLDIQFVFLLIFTGLYFSADIRFTTGLVLSSISVSLELTWLVVAYKSITKENGTLFKIFLPLTVVMPAYILVVVIHFSQDPDIGSGSKLVKMVILGSLAIINRSILIYVALLVRRNFDKGLKQRLFEKDKSGSAPRGVDVFNQGPLPIQSTRSPRLTRPSRPLYVASSRAAFHDTNSDTNSDANPDINSENNQFSSHTPYSLLSSELPTQRLDQTVASAGSLSMTDSDRVSK